MTWGPSFSSKLTDLEEKLEGADAKLRAEVEGVINKMKAHPPLKIRRATYERDTIAAQVVSTLSNQFYCKCQMFGTF